MPTKVSIVKAMIFPAVMYKCKSWTIKKAEHRRINAFELWYWRRLLRVSWTARRSNQSILKEINPEYSLEELMLKLKFKYFGHLMGRTDSGKDPDAGKDWRQEEKKMTEDEMVEWHHLLDGHEFEQAQEVGCGWGEGSLVWPSSRHYKEWDTTKRLNRTDVREDARVWSHNSFLWYVPQLSGTCILSYYLLSFLRAHQGECLWFDDC